LRPELLSLLLDQAGGRPPDRIILILMDALSLHRLQRWMNDGNAPIWGALAGQGFLARLTSLVPSTTTAALTTLWSGLSPAEHALAGYELWLKEYGVVANMIRHAPFTFQGDAGSLSRAGFDPQTYLTSPTLGVHLAAHGIKTYALQHRSILGSSLSKMLFKDVDAHAFNTSADLWVNLRHLIENRPREQQYVWVYWEEVDRFSHLYGPDDERTAAEFAAFSFAFEQIFLRRLPASLRSGTLLLLTADHGQISTRLDPHYDLRNHLGLIRRLHILPTGENRLAYLYIRPGQVEAVREYLERTWPNQFDQLDPVNAVEHGLFGPGAPHPRLLERLGDLLAPARGAAYLWWAAKENELHGRHGGLSSEEMLVPLLATRL
jgi:predicted AlkP superfamily pyrophosphatase or phosphodiesterase